MSHFVPEVFRSRYYVVETTVGTEVIPYDVHPSATHNSQLAAYCEGETQEPNAEVITEQGWLARLTAPGYRDATDWITAGSEESAWTGLLEAYGDDDCFRWAWEPGQGYHRYCRSTAEATAIRVYVQSINGCRIEQDGDFLYTVDDSEDPSDEVNWVEG